MTPRRVLTLILWVFVAGRPVAPQSASSGVKVPLWGRDLVLGLDPRVHTERLQDSNRAGVTFLANQQLLVYALYRNSEQLSSRESPEFSSPFRLHVWSVDAASGQVQTEKEWGTRVHDSAVQATTGGVLVKTGRIVRLYSADFREARDLPFPLPVDPNALVSTHVSPTGKTVVIDQPLRASDDQILRPWMNPRYNHLDVLDATSLATRFSWNLSPQLYGRYSISDVGIVASASNGSVIRSARFGSSRWDVIFDDPNRTCVGDYPTAVTDETVAIHCKDLTVITSPGVSFSLPIDFRGISADTCQADAPVDARKTTVALGSQVMALSSPVLKAKKHLLSETTVCLTGLQIAVFDLVQKKQIFTLSLDPVPRNDYDFALSPDGSKLALLNDRRVAVYSVHSPM
jgi:hypothetical protein